jgi:hypothetical protein
MGLRFCRNLDFEKVKKGGLDFKEIVRWYYFLDANW